MAGKLIQLDEEIIDNSLGLLERTTNAGVIERISGFAQLVQNTGDQNEITLQLLEACKKYQANYNGYIDSVGEVIESGRAISEIAVHMKTKADTGELTNRDLSFGGRKVDTSSVQ